MRRELIEKECDFCGKKEEYQTNPKMVFGNFGGTPCFKDWVTLKETNQGDKHFCCRGCLCKYIDREW